MGKQVLKNIRLYAGAFSLHSETNNAALQRRLEVVDASTFGVSSREKASALHDWSASYQGFVDYDTTTVQAQLDDDQAAGNLVTVSFGGVSAAPVGSIGYAGRALHAEVSRFGQLAQMAPFTLNVQGSGRLVPGTVMENAAIVATGNGAGAQLGAVSAAQKAYCALHCVAFDGTSLDINVESDDNAGFTTAVVRGSFAQLTDVGSEWLEISGPITDDYWRLDYTLVGTSATIFAVMGIAAG